MNWDDAIDFSFEGQTKEAKVLSVYDGDTVKIAFPLGDTMYRWNCRILGVDTPELRTRNLKEKEMGYMVRDKLREKVLDKIVNVTCGDFDKYGRLLIKITCEDGDDVSDWLISNEYAYAYNGGTKRQWPQ
jgi:endonuclease YncB( thermonuclease family)